LSDAVIAAAVGVGGAVLVAIVSTVTQMLNTRHVLREEHRLRGHEWRQTRLVAAISDLLAAADPQISPGGDYGRVVQLIHRVQLLLDPNNVTEARLNGALNRLGTDLQAYVGVRHEVLENKTVETTDLLAAQAAVLETARAVLAQRERRA
jgi:hypothetical protein